MRHTTVLLLFLITPILCGAGQVYQSKDADGNTVFSDMPSAGAEVIKVAPTNSADPVQNIPALAAPEKSEEQAQPAEKLTKSTATVEHDEHSDYWVTNGVNRDDIDDGRRGRETRRDTPITERPRVQPLPSAARPATGGVGRR